MDLGFKDGTADAMFLKAIALMNSINLKFESLKEDNHNMFDSQSHHH